MPNGVGNDAQRRAGVDYALAGNSRTTLSNELDIRTRPPKPHRGALIGNVVGTSIRQRNGDHKMPCSDALRFGTTLPAGSSPGNGHRRRLPDFRGVANLGLTRIPYVCILLRCSAIARGGRRFPVGHECGQVQPVGRRARGDCRDPPTEPNAIDGSPVGKEGESAEDERISGPRRFSAPLNRVRKMPKIGAARRQITGCGEFSDRQPRFRARGPENTQPAATTTVPAEPAGD